MNASHHSSTPPSIQRGVTRRGFLVGALATGALVACGSDGDGDATADTVADAGGAAGTNATEDGAGSVVDTGDQTYTLIQRFPQGVQIPGRVRLPISLSTGSAQLVQDGPAELGAQVTDLDGNPIGERITAVRRDVAPGAYYAFRPVIDEVGLYSLHVDGGPAEGAAFEVSDPSSVAVPGPGDPMPPFDTPTADDARGVDPICTLEPDPCPFHDITLTDALQSGKSVAYIVGTPAFCSTGSCTPALESMVDLRDEFSDRYTFVHAEVYTDDTATDPAPAVGAANLTYEPVLFVVGADGNVIERLDAVWNESELVEVLTAAG